jgi:sugar lactone lactonase YvrE
MRKPNCLHLLLTAAALAALPLIANSARAGRGDIYETNNGMVLRFQLGGASPITFAQGLSNPKGLAFDGNGHLFVADASAGILIRFTLPDGTGSVFASGFSSPIGVTFDATGNLFVGESGNGSITKIGQDGSRTTFAIGLGSPAGLAFANNGNLFVSDFAGGVIYRITPDGTKSTFVSGLGFPAGLAFESAGNLFEADSNTGTIFKFAPNGTKTTFASGLGRPYGLAFEDTGNLVVTDNARGATLRYSPAGVQSNIFTNDFNTPQFVAIEPAPHQLLNISTRGTVLGGDHLLIAGFVVGGNGPVGTTVVVRALGPSLSTSGITDPLADPALELRDSSGALVASNNNWNDAPVEQRLLPPFQPLNVKEAGFKLVLRGGAYTAIVSNADGTTGIALVEVYNLQ